MKAFPTEHPLSGTMDLMSDGMDLRDYFAAKALPIAYKFWMFDFYELKLGDEEKFNGGFYKNLKLISETAYEMADEMMEARKA